MIDEAGKVWILLILLLTILSNINDFLKFPQLSLFLEVSNPKRVF